MREFFESIMPNVIPKLPALWNATLETLAMTGISALYILVIGMALGILLTVTKKGGLLENPVVYRVLDIIINLLRSVPFIILLFLLIPLTRIISGTSLFKYRFTFFHSQRVFDTVGVHRAAIQIH